MSSETKVDYIEDHLSEDIPINNQQFFVLSYLLPGDDNELDKPLFKVRGSYKTIEECQDRIKRLERNDKYFHMYICEVGKWGTLYTKEQFTDLKDVDTVYANEQLNEMMKQYKLNQDHAQEEELTRQETMIKRAKFEGTKEGQEYLANLKESPVAVKSRIDFSISEIEKLKKKLSDIENIYNKDKELFDKYTVKELLEIKDMEGKTNPLTGNLITLGDNGLELTEGGESNGEPEETKIEVKTKIDPKKFVLENGGFDNKKFNELFEKKGNTSSSSKYHDLFDNAYNSSSTLGGSPAFQGDLISSNQNNIINTIDLNQDEFDNKKFNELFEGNLTKK